MTDSVRKPGPVGGNPPSKSERPVPVRKFAQSGLQEGVDSIAVEEPLEIRLEWPSPGSIAADHSVGRTIAVTMRTPGHDEELAIGFLFTEGILHSAAEVRQIVSDAARGSSVTVVLKAQPELAGTQLERNFYVTSSCGVCGKASIEAIRAHAQFPAGGDEFCISAARLVGLPAELERRQEVFRGTGSIHAAALFSLAGLDDAVYEDVGRHNAVDKLLGAALRDGRLPLRNRGILVSGRASFELVQKARMAGLSMLASVGAPSSLAIDLAWDADLTLIGFLRDGRFNIYTGPARVSRGDM